MRLKDDVAIVTGAGTGIGKAIAVGFAKEGANIVACARRLEPLEETIKAVKDFGRDGLAVQMDVSKKKDIEKTVSKTLDKFTKIDILVNNAAMYSVSTFLETSEEELLAVLTTNLAGPYMFIQVVAKEMAKKGYGRIVNISSSQASVGTPGMPHYSASKGGLNALTRAAAVELGRNGITVNAISCGLTMVEHARRIIEDVYPPGMADMLGSMLPAGRNGVAEDYVEPAILLASKKADYITGAVFAVDGGTTGCMQAPISG